MVVFSSISPHLQQKVLQKLSFVEFSHLSQCSKLSHAVSKFLKLRLPLKKEKASITKAGFHLPYEIGHKKNLLTKIFNAFPVKIQFDCISFMKYLPGHSNEIIDLFEKGTISTKEIRIICSLKKMTPETFNQLLKVSKVEKLSYDEVVPDSFLLQPELKRIPGLRFRTLDPFPFDVLLTFTACDLHLYPCSFTPNELNRFFKQWHQGSRNIQEVFFNYGEVEVGVNQDDAIFEGIPHEIIWSRDFHSKSVISDWPFEEMARWGREYRSYALKRGDEQLLLMIFEHGISIQLVDNAFEAFVKHVTPLA